MNDLHAEIMNLEPCESEADYYDSHHEATDSAYQKGFRDARHAAAELVSAALSAPPGFVLVPVEPTPLPPYYIGGPYIDGSYAMCEVATARVVFKTAAAPSAPVRCDAARDFPANTCPASRHAEMIGEALMRGEPYPMLTEEPGHCGESILSVVASLWEARTKLSAPALPQWMPIETAPKDGTQVLLSNGTDVSEGHWLHLEGGIHERRDLEGRYIDQDEDEGYDGWIDWSGGMNPEPSHWMPLPAAPSAKEPTP